MKKTMKYFSMAALALVGTVMSSCSNDDDTATTVQPESEFHNVETLTATVSMNADGATRALTSEGVKTFAVGDEIAVIYTDKFTGYMTKATSVALTAEDISADGKSANFTVTLTDPDKSEKVSYIYPANMANNDGSINDDALKTQDGTLENLAKDFDCGYYRGDWDGESLPTGELENRLAICAFDIKDATGSSIITSSITGLVVNDGANTYTIRREAAAGPIYVAIAETSGATIDYFATDGSKYYARLATGKTYEAGKMYPIGLRMAEVVRGKFSVSSTKQVYFSKSNLQATTSDNGSNWSWHFGPNQYARVGNGANIYISGNGTVSNDGNGKNIDLFGWSTSATHLGIHNSTTNTDYQYDSKTDGSDFVDWGSASEVTACIGTGWRTLTSDEWRYLLKTRSGNRFAKAKINSSRSGIVLLPDDWDIKNYSLNNINDDDVDFSVNNITSDNWTSKLEAHGAVFLPVAGQRNKDDSTGKCTKVNGADSELHYWSSTGGINGSKVPIANQMYVTSSSVAPDTGAGRCNGYSVRLVRDVRE